MVNYLVTFARSLSGEMERLNSGIEVIIWENDSGETRSPQELVVSCPLRIPTRPQKNGAIVKSSAEFYKDKVREKITADIRNLEEKLRDRLPQFFQKERAQKELLEKFLDEIDEKIYLEGPFPTSEGDVYHCAVGA